MYNVHTDTCPDLMQTPEQHVLLMLTQLRREVVGALVDPLSCRAALHALQAAVAAFLASRSLGMSGLTSPAMCTCKIQDMSANLFLNICPRQDIEIQQEVH